MSLIPRNSIFEFDNFFDHFFAPAANTKESGNAFFAPRIDLKDNNDHYLVSAELPGVKKEDIHVTLENGILSIEAESKQEDKEEKDGKIIRQERRYGKFMRSFNVGDSVHQDDITANFKDGILTLKAPKATTVPEKTKRIEIG